MTDSVLGGLAPERFLRTHWQRRPLLVKRGAGDIAERFEPADLLQLASRDDVESRLVLRQRGRYSVRHGPFARRVLERLPQRGWALLVQGADLHLDAARALMDRFAFIPYARHDDVMLSLAPPGGGVGAHFDSYDVFLVQARGRRRWRFGAQRDLRLRPDAPLRLLQAFQPRRELEVEPGDVLYLPPRQAHEGVALSECITCSVGFRAPSSQELVTSFLQWLPEKLALRGRYRDRASARQRHPAELGDTMVRELSAMLRAARWSHQRVEHFLGEYLTEPKAHVWFEAPARALPYAAFARRARSGGVRLSRRTRMLFRDGVIFVNGDAVRLPAAGRDALIALADARAAAPWRSRSEHATRLLYDWYRCGYVELF